MAGQLSNVNWGYFKAFDIICWTVFFLYCSDFNLIFFPSKPSTMNYMYLLYVHLLLSYFTEIHSSAKPSKETKPQKKELKPLKGPHSTSRNDEHDEDNTQNRFLRTFLLNRQKRPRSSTENSFQRVRKITKRPTTTTNCKIFCRCGYHLQILPSGVVRGTVDQDSEYGKNNLVNITIIKCLKPQCIQEKFIAVHIWTWMRCKTRLLRLL